jgi:hypothetical protein
VQQGADPALYDRLLQEPMDDFGSGSSWGELVPYARWCARYAPSP